MIRRIVVLNHPALERFIILPFKRPRLSLQDILAACVADIQAVRDRDPACDSFIVCALYFKGFQALQSYRVAHWMWQNGRKVLT